VKGGLPFLKARGTVLLRGSGPYVVKKIGVAASTREIDIQNLTRVPRFGESIDRQESENQTEVLGFELTDHEMDRQ